MPMRVAGVIIAGGQSTRMGGGDKCLKLLDDRPLLAHVAERLRGQSEALVLNANGDPARFSPWMTQIVPDEMPDLGPLGGIHAGLKWAAAHPSGFTHIVTAAADTPFFPLDLTNRLTETAAGMDRVALAASAGRVHPVFGLWPVTMLEALGAFLARAGAASVRRFAEGEGRAAIAEFPLEDGFDPFFNVNTPGDLTLAREIAARRNTKL